MLLDADRDVTVHADAEARRRRSDRRRLRTDQLAQPGAPGELPYDQTFPSTACPGRPRSPTSTSTVTPCRTVRGTPRSRSGAPLDRRGLRHRRRPGDVLAAELDAVQEIWQRVGEDYAALQIDVTTEAPRGRRARPVRAPPTPSSAPAWWSPTPPSIYSSCGCGGVSYVGGFNYVNPGDPSGATPYYQPGYVFQNGVGHRAEDRRRGRQPRDRSLPRAQPRRHGGRWRLRRSGRLGADHGHRLLQAGDPVEQGRVRRGEPTPRTTSR